MERSSYLPHSLAPWPLLSIAILLISTSSAQQLPPGEQIQSCWNKHYNATPHGFKDWVMGKPASLYLADVWWSSKDRDLPVTIVTMASMDRLHMLERQCRDYRGPLAAAVYLALRADDSSTVEPSSDAAAAGSSSAGASGGAFHGSRGGNHGSSESGLGAAFSWLWKDRDAEAAKAAMELVEVRHKGALDKARGMLRALFKRMEEEVQQQEPVVGKGAGSRFFGFSWSKPTTNRNTSKSACCCALRLMLFAERVSDRQLAALMPTNAMRNAAMMAAQSPLALMLDVDLGISSDFSTLVANPEWVTTVMDPGKNGKSAFAILPAWETGAKLDSLTALEVTEAALTGNKEDVASLWRNRTINVFEIDVCPGCHAPIDHPRWIHSHEPYAVTHQRYFEPWGIIQRLHNPFYDERFRGWNYDKIQHVEFVGRMSKIQMFVLPDAWLVHRPHNKVALATLEATYKRNNGRMVAGALRSRNEHLNALLQVGLLQGLLANRTAYSIYKERVERLMKSEWELKRPEEYKPQVNRQLLDCRSTLQWWRTRWWRMRRRSL